MVIIRRYYVNDKKQIDFAELIVTRISLRCIQVADFNDTCIATLNKLC
jgi:hypothetical protein